MYISKEEIEAEWRRRNSVVRVLEEATQWFTRQSAWALPDLPCSLRDVLLSLQAGERNKASNYIKAVFPSFWHAGAGPATRYRDADYTRAILAYRFGYNREREIFDIHWDSFRRACEVQRKTVSFFQPSVAFALYRKLLGDVNAPAVWDPSSGFGARLLGFAAAYPNGTYRGNEPASMTYKDLGRLAQSLPKTGDYRLVQAGSEVESPPSESVDLVFTSPPFFRKERYFPEVTQCNIAYPTRMKWRSHYLRPTLDRARAALKPDCLAVLHCDRELADDAEKAMATVGFFDIRVEQNDMKPDHYLRRLGRKTKEYYVYGRK